MLLEIKGKVPVRTDKGFRQYEWVLFEDRAWILALGLVSPDGKSVQPIRLVAMRVAPGFSIDQADPAHLQAFQGFQLPASLLEQGVIPPALERAIEVREFHWDTESGTQGGPH